MTDPIRAALERLVAADEFIGEAGPEYQHARDAARAVLEATPAAPLKERPDFIAGYREGLADGRRIVEHEDAAIRAALEAVPEGPSLEEVTDLCEEHCFNVESYESIECLQGLLNDAISRWGRPTTPPAVTDEPADAEGGLLPREAFADRVMCKGRENWLAGPRGVITLPGAAAAPVAPPTPDAVQAVEALAARPLLEQVAAIGGCISEQTVGRVRVLADRASAWLAENPPGRPVAIEPRGCPMPGACSCVEPPTPQPVATPGEEYHDDLGPVLWWRFPVEEPPYSGTPNDSDWPGYHTHFTPLPQVPCCPTTTPAGQEKA